MKIRVASTVLAAFCVCFFCASYTMAKEESHSVSASVRSGGSAAGINAERVPGHFTVPEGHIATGFRYNFSDPSSGYTSTRLSGSNIYSDTQGRYMSEVEGNPNAQLPPGKYKFVVGGHPGAQGTLSFKLVATTTEPPADGQPSNRLGLPRNFDATFSPRDIYVIMPEGRKRVGDFEGMEQWDWPEQVVVHFRDGKVSAEWSGRLKGNDTTASSHTSKIAGTFVNGRFSGTDTAESLIQTTLRDHGRVSWKPGTVWSLEGTVEPSGLLVLHGRWKSDFGQTLHMRKSGDGYVPTLKPNESAAETKAIRTELHLRLPVGRSSSPPRTTSTEPPATQRSGTPTLAPPLENTIWDNPKDDVPWESPAEPPDTPTGRTRSSDPRTADGQSKIDAPTDADGPKVGDRLSDGKVLFKPPWDVGEPYPMDPDEVAEIKKKQADGYRWSDRHGWVNAEDEKRIEHITDVEKRGEAKESERTKDSLDKLKESEDREKEHADQAKRAGDLAIMQKAKALGWDSLTADEKEKLSKADDDIKDHLRGEPKEVRGYKRGVVDNTLPQGAIDATHKALEGVKWAADESVDFLGSKTGPAGKAVGTAYTMGTKILGKVSEENAKYNAGTSEKADYTKAATEGAKEGLTDVIVNELSGAVNEKVTDSLLNSKLGKKAADYVEGQSDRARKQLARDALSGKVDDLNARALDKAGDAAAEAAKQNINYGVGRVAKPGHEATMKRPVKDAVDWGVGTDEPRQQKEAPEPGDKPAQADELDDQLEE